MVSVCILYNSVGVPQSLTGNCAASFPIPLQTGRHGKIDILADTHRIGIQTDNTRLLIPWQLETDRQKDRLGILDRQKDRLAILDRHIDTLEETDGQTDRRQRDKVS